MLRKTLPTVALLILLQLFALESYATETNQKNNLPTIDVMLEEVKFDCSEFKPNLITKFLLREGPARELLYKKCIDQNEDDAAFTKYNESMINDGNIKDLSIDLKNAQTRLTILTLTTALKNYLTDPSTNDDKMEFIKSAVDGFKQHYIEKRAMLDVEIKEMKRRENPRNKKTVELLKIIEENEADLGKNIDSTIRYMEFVVKDRHSFVLAHNKFFPKIYEKSEEFYKTKLTQYECDFLELNFGEEWVDVKKDLSLSCIKSKEKVKINPQKIVQTQ